MMMSKLTFDGEVFLSDISDRSKVKVTIEISLPPLKDGQQDIEEAREFLKETYGNIAKMMANYLGATQYTLIANPEAGVESALILYKHFTKAIEEVTTIGLEDITQNEQPEKDFLRSYQ